MYEFIAMKFQSYSVLTVIVTGYKPDSEMPLPVYIDKAVAKRITRVNIKRVTHQGYRQMLNDTANIATSSIVKFDLRFTRLSNLFV